MRALMEGSKGVSTTHEGGTATGREFGEIEQRVVSMDEQSRAKGGPPILKGDDG